MSPACRSCYAETWARRYGVGWGPAAPRKTFGEKHWAEPLKWARRAAKDGVRRRVFTSSMADVFEDHPTVDAERPKLWDLVDATWGSLDWLVLTKRIDRVIGCLAKDGRPPDYLKSRMCWVGTTAEDQEWYNRRVVHLLEVPAGVRFVSAEPLLGPIDPDRVPCPYGPHYPERREPGYCSRCCNDYDRDSFGYIKPLSNGEIGWFVAGGESGHSSRPSHPDWFRRLRDSCVATGTSFHFKQWGTWVADGQARPCLVDAVGRRSSHVSRALFPDGSHLPDLTGWGTNGDGAIVVRKVGKKHSGRLLDGVTWGQFPEVGRA